MSDLKEDAFDIFRRKVIVKCEKLILNGFPVNAIATAIGETQVYFRKEVKKLEAELEAELEEVRKEKRALIAAKVKDLIKDYNELEEFESPHVIFQMAQDVDRLNNAVKQLDAELNRVNALNDSAIGENLDLKEKNRQLIAITWLVEQGATIEELGEGIQAYKHEWKPITPPNK